MDVPIPQKLYCKQLSCLLSNLHEFYRQNVLCDVTLCVDEVKVEAHRTVLAASSPYFCAMFTSDLSEKNERTITMHSVDATTFPLIIDYMYTANINITNNNVQEIFTTANLFQMTELMKLCSLHMQEEIHISNCVSLYHFASLQHALSLKSVAKTFIVNHFKVVNATEEFFILEKEDLCEVLRDDNLNIQDEMIVFDTAMNWLNFDFHERKCSVEEVLKTVRFSLIDPELLGSIITSLECFKNCAVLSKCILDVCQQQKDLNQSYRIGMFEQEMLVFAGGSQSKHTRSLSCYDPITKRNYYAIQPYLSFDFKYRIDHHKIVTADDNQVYLIGGVFYDVYHYEEIGQALGEVKAFDPHEKVWKDKASMIKPRCAHAAVPKGNEIYVFGGKSHYPKGEPLDSVEVYNIENNTWRSMSCMPQALSHHGAAIVDNAAYIVGGYNNYENSEVMSEIYQFLIDVDQWSKSPVQLQIPRGEFGITVHDEDIYVIGGNRGPFKVAFVEVINIPKMRTKFVADFPEDRKSMSAVTMNSKVYVCGGIRTIISRMNHSPRSVETRDLWSYDPTTDIWTKEAKLVQYANIHGCTVAKMNLRRLYESEFVSSV